MNEYVNKKSKSYTCPVCLQIQADGVFIHSWTFEQKEKKELHKTNKPALSVWPHFQ